MNDNNKGLISGIIRQIIYLILLTLTVFLMWKVGDMFKSSAVQEYGLFESAQSVVLLLIAISFGIQAACNRAYRPILFALCMLALAALVREQDSYFDEALPCIGWAWCWLFPLAGLASLIRNRHSIAPVLRHFLRSNAFHMMMSALIIIIPVAQCLGHRSFLADLLGNIDIDTHLVRRILEEPIELIGYLQIFLASIETMFELRQK